MIRLDLKQGCGDLLETLVELERRQEEPQQSLLGSRRQWDKSWENWKDWKETETAGVDGD